MAKDHDIPKNTFWRGDTLYGRIMVAGEDIAFTLRIRSPLRPGDRTLARERIEERRAAEIAALHFGKTKRSYDDVITAWEDWIGGQVGARTAARYATSLAQMQNHLRGRPLPDITKGAVGEIVQARQSTGVTNATIRRDLTALSSVLSYAEAMDWYEGNPALLWLKKLSERRDPIILPDPAHIHRVLNRAPGLLRALTDAAWRTGARQEELVTARRNQFDGTAKQLTIIGKGNRLRVIDLEGWGFETFRALPAALGGAHLFWHSNGLPYCNVSSRFAGYVRDEMAAAVKFAKTIGPDAEPDFRPFRFHDLRHRHAVDWLKSGRSIYDLQQRLGHASIKTTEIYLAYLTPEEIRKAKYGTKYATQNPSG